MPPKGRIEVADQICKACELCVTFCPKEVIALAPEGVNRRSRMLAALSPESLVIKAAGIELPLCHATVIEVDFKARKIKSHDWALAALVVLARQNKALTMEMLTAALKLRFKKAVFEKAVAITKKITD